MRQRRLFLVLILAVASGALAGYSILQYLRQRPTPLIASEARDTRPVVVANRDMGLGEVVGEEDVRVVEWPASSLPEGYSGSVPEVAGRGLISEIRRNEPILAVKLADAGLGGGLPPLIPPGMRALAVKVDEVIGVAGFVTPQTRVDVILTMTPPGGSENVSKVILQNIQALAANQQIQRTEDGEPIISTVVTVLVDLEQAEKLVLASTQGRIQMALRNTLDLESVETEGLRASNLLSAPRRPAASTVRTGATQESRAPSIIEMYRGGVRTLITYGNGNN
jgi:pilus assembly protein CpaB